jgi:CRP-like cAMP-binding protein/Fe-S-cluster-containing hydrogenase component 2
MATDFYRELAEQVDHELEACIGCHLCMRACPLPESNLIPIGELNDATAGGPMSGRILKFTLDCTQCGACVPVCPADLSRMRMVLAAKLRVEEPPADALVYFSGQAGGGFSGWTVGRLAAQLARYPIFAGVSEAQLRAFIPRVALRSYHAGSVIVREGEYSNSVYVVLTGAVEQSIITADNQRRPLLKLTPGSFFGEFSILSDRPNPWTITTTEPTIALAISDAALRRLMTEAPLFGERLQALHARVELSAYLRRVDLFRDVPEQMLAWIIARATVRDCERGAVIAREDEPATVFHLVLNGFVKVSRRVPDGSERVLTYQRDGTYFADWAFVSDRARGTTLVANTRCEIIELSRSDLESFLAQHPAARRTFAATATQHYQFAVQALGPQPLAGARHLTTLLDEGVLQSHALLLIDTRLCIDCNNCVDACVRRHGHPRLERRGLVVGPYLVATACRHCDDPLCLLCPVDGIIRAPDGQITITDNCIGCGACAARCPYDNIRMADKQQIAERGEQQGGFWQAVRNFIRPHEEGMITFDQDDLRPKVAVKCDLCAGYGDGPACVNNCPTGAAFRADGARFFGSGEQIAVLPVAARPRAR